MNEQIAVYEFDRAWQADMSSGWQLVEHARSAGVDNIRERLDAGAPLNDRNMEGQTALMQAAMLGIHNDTVKLLIERGADLHCQDNRGNTALQSTVSASTMRILLDAGSQVDTQNDDGQTALHISAMGWDGERVQLLLERGADTTLVDRMGNTAEELAGGEAKQVLIDFRVNRDRDALRQVVGLDANQDEPVQRHRKM